MKTTDIFDSVSMHMKRCGMARELSFQNEDFANDVIE